MALAGEVVCMSEVECPHCGGPVEVNGDQYRCRRGVQSRGETCYADWSSLRLEREAAAEIAAYLRQLFKQ